MTRYYAKQNKDGDGVDLSLMDISGESANCKNTDDINIFINAMLKKYGGNVDDCTLMFSSSLNWPRDHPDCTDGCVALCNYLTGNTIE